MSGSERAAPVSEQLSAVTQNHDEIVPGPPTTTTDTADVPYSVYTVNQKRCIILAASLAGFFSPLSSSIYSPVLSTVASDLAVSNTEINLTVTTYMVSVSLFLRLNRWSETE